MNTEAIGGPCKLCGRTNAEHGAGQCPRPEWANEAIERLKVRLLADPEVAKALLPNMMHAEVKAAMQKGPT